MHFHDIILMAMGLGADAMSVCMGVGVKWNGPHQKFRLAWHMGLFQFLMPVIGFIVGEQVASLVATWGRYVAAGLVFLVGAKMLWEAIRSHAGATAERVEHATEPRVPAGQDPTRGWSLFVLSVATSVDALLVGFSLALEGQREIVWPSVVIGIVAAGMSLTGAYVGQRAGAAFGKRAEIVGALLLMGLAVSFAWP